MSASSEVRSPVRPQITIDQMKNVVAVDPVAREPTDDPDVYGGFPSDDDEPIAAAADNPRGAGAGSQREGEEVRGGDIPAQAEGEMVCGPCEAEVPRGLPDPGTPTAAERAAHELTHFPF